MLKHCAVSLQRWPPAQQPSAVHASVFPLPHWTWAGPGTHFNQQKVAEVTAYLFRAEALGRPGNLCSCVFCSLEQVCINRRPAGGILWRAHQEKGPGVIGVERPTWAQPPSRTCEWNHLEGLAPRCLTAAVGCPIGNQWNRHSAGLQLTHRIEIIKWLLFSAAKFWGGVLGSKR